MDGKFTDQTYYVDHPISGEKVQVTDAVEVNFMQVTRKEDLFFFNSDELQPNPISKDEQVFPFEHIEEKDVEGVKVYSLEVRKDPTFQ